MTLDEEIAELDALIEARFREHPHAEVIRSLPGMGTQTRAEFIAATGGDMDAFGSPDRLAGFAGLAPRHATPVASAAICAAPGDTTAVATLTQAA